jgi:hypothetical protein
MASGGPSADLRGQRLEMAAGVGDEGGLQHQVLRLVAGQEHLRQRDEVRARRPFPRDAPRAPWRGCREVAHDRVELRQRQPQAVGHASPRRGRCRGISPARRRWQGRGPGLHHRPGCAGGCFAHCRGRAAAILSAHDRRRTLPPPLDAAARAPHAFRTARVAAVLIACAAAAGSGRDADQAIRQRRRLRGHLPRRPPARPRHLPPAVGLRVHRRMGRRPDRGPG